MSDVIKTTILRDKNGVMVGMIDQDARDGVAANATEISKITEEKQDKVTPQMYGAVADGVTDDTEAFVRAISENKRLFVPAGNYCITNLSPGNCEIIGERGARLLVSGAISYEGVYYPRMSNVALVSAGENREYMMLIKESYYGLFEGVQFSNKDSKAVEIGVLLDGSGEGNGVYYQRFEHCVFDHLPIGIKFYSVANVHTVAKSVFYKCGICVYNDSAESILITENCFQDFTVSGVKIDKTVKGFPVSNWIQGNYFEADSTCADTTFVGDIDFSSNDKCKGNFVQSNHYTWIKAAHHVVNMVSENMIQDFYTGQESARPNRLMGITALHVAPHTFPTAYTGDHMHGSLMPVEEEDGSIRLYFYGKTSSGQNAWHRVITTGANEDSTLTLPPIFANRIGQGYGGYIQVGYDADDNENPSDRWMTYDNGQKLLMVYNQAAEKWEHYQKVTSGTTAERPTWKPSGYQYYDTDLGKPIFATGSNTWVDSDGNDPDIIPVSQEFELIDTVTVEENSDGTFVETEPDGTAFSFRKMSVQIITPAGTEKKAASIYFYLSDGKVLNSYAENIVGTAETTTWHHVTISDKRMVECQYVQQVVNGSGHYSLVGDSAQKSFRYVSDYNVKVVRFMGGNTLPAGTVIKIYGLRD